MTTFRKLEGAIIEWAQQRGIFEKGTPTRQALKTLEECGELIEAVAKDDKDAIRDAIGDITTTLIIQAAMQDFDFESCVREAYNVIKNRTGSMVGGTFVKD